MTRFGAPPMPFIVSSAVASDATSAARARVATSRRRGVLIRGLAYQTTRGGPLQALPSRAIGFRRRYFFFAVFFAVAFLAAFFGAAFFFAAMCPPSNVKTA